MKEYAPECARCGEKSSEDTLTLYSVVGFICVMIVMGLTKGL